MRAGDRAKHVASLERRRDWLEGRLARWIGEPNQAKIALVRELAALRWSLRLIAVVQSEGMLDDLRRIGHDL